VRRGADCSWWYDLATPPQTAVEHLIQHLLPLTGLPAAAGAEWWVHSRPNVADFGHQLHFDMEERGLEATGMVAHPAVSSVVYLSGNSRGVDGVGSTLVLDQTIDADAFAERGWLVRPAEDGFMTFPGDRLHGVIPGAPPSRRRGSAAADVPTRRLTLMIGWWAAEQCAAMGPGHRRPHGPGPACTVPRGSPHVSWPASLSFTAAEDDDAAAAGSESTADGVDVCLVSPVWEEMDSPDGPTGPPLEIPRSIDQRFFVRGVSDFRDAVYAEHFPGGQ
jgi:hypothetical protein